jgi:hypothetical protein
MQRFIIGRGKGAILAGELGGATVRIGKRIGRCNGQIGRVNGVELGGENWQANWEAERCKIGPCRSADLAGNLEVERGRIGT